VQYAPGLFRYLKARVDQDRNQSNQYLLTGSQKFTLMEGVRESLAGRVSVVNLHTLSLAELQAFRKKPLSRDDILELCWKGGYPEVHSGSLPPHQIFLRLAAFRSGQLVSYASLAADAGVSPNTVKAWLGVLEASGIIHLLQPYFRNFGKRLIKTPKLYFLDTGLLCFLLDLHSAKHLQESTLLGPVFETLVLGQILRARANSLDPATIYFYREQNGLEIDFVIPEGEKLHLIECKHSGEPTAVAKTLREIESRLPEGTVAGRTLITSRPARMHLKELKLELRDPITPV
jgi:predicted AAA+ superfamily ATPase